ncbi:diguanylate cyclase [Methylophaga sp.]|uniref:GGDEF domain-containing protein n=1 Tax=Methylophaga sp. TaxID=2024840 RepID=UPI003F69E059
MSGLAAGANDFVSKPYHPEVLRARVNVAKRMLDMQDTLNKTLEKLDVLAHLDELTELNNRRAAIQLIQKEMARANREKTSLCIGICDIDHFKNVNDHHGHHVGDLVLKEVAQSLHDNLRSYDVIGRYGGEEFVFALIGNEAEARMILERTRRAIEQRSVPHNGNGVRVTMSFGAVIQGVDNEKADLSSLLECADQALYQSKKSGRNRLTLASELSATAHFG